MQNISALYRALLFVLSVFPLACHPQTLQCTSYLQSDVRCGKPGNMVSNVLHHSTAHRLVSPPSDRPYLGILTDCVFCTHPAMKQNLYCLVKVVLTMLQAKGTTGISNSWKLPFDYCQKQSSSQSHHNQSIIIKQ